MIKEHFNKIVITSDGALIGDKDGNVGEMIFTDESYITVDKLAIMKDIELPKCIKEINQTISCYCYCPTTLKNIGKLCNEVWLDLDNGLDKVITVEEIQDMLDLTVNSFGSEHISYVEIHIWKRVNNEELHFDTDAEVELHGIGNNLIVRGRVKNLFITGSISSNNIKLHPDFTCDYFECNGEEVDYTDYIDYSSLPDLDESLEDGNFEFKDLARRIPPRIRNGKLNGTLKSVRWTTTTNLDDIWNKIPDIYKKIICRTMSRYIGSALKQIADDDGWEFTQKNGFSIHTCWGEDELKKLGITKYNIDYRGGSSIHIRYEFHIEKFGGLPDLDESADIKINKRLKQKISTKIQKGEKSGDINSIHWTLTTSADEFWDKIPDDLKSELLERISWVFVDRGGEEDEISADYEGVVGVQYLIWTDYSTDDILGMGFTAHDITIREDNESSVLLSFKISLDKLGNLPDLDESLLGRLKRLLEEFDYKLVREVSSKIYDGEKTGVVSYNGEQYFFDVNTSIDEDWDNVATEMQLSMLKRFGVKIANGKLSDDIFEYIDDSDPEADMNFCSDTGMPEYCLVPMSYEWGDGYAWSVEYSLEIKRLKDLEDL